MKNSQLLYAALACVLLALVFGTSDHLSELAYVFLALAVVGFGWYMYRRTWADAQTSTTGGKAGFLTKVSTALAISGVAAIGIGAIGLFSEAVQELGLLIVGGAMVLILALMVRILHGILLKRASSTIGSLSIISIIALLAVIAAILLFVYIIYAILIGLGLV